MPAQSDLEKAVDALWWMTTIADQLLDAHELLMLSSDVPRDEQAKIVRDYRGAIDLGKQRLAELPGGAR